MKSPKLEIASWIAAILSTSIAIAALYAQLVQPGQSPASQPSVSPPIAAASEAPLAVASEPVSDYRKRLRFGLDAALKLGNSRSRDEAILHIVKSAIRDDYYMFAFEASRSLASTEARDASSEVLSCLLSHSGEYKEARTVALAIGDPRVRDSALRSISSLATVKPGEGDNEHSCDFPFRRLK